MTPDAFAALKSDLGRRLRAASPNHALRLGPALYDLFAREGLLVERVFRTAHPPIVTAIFPTYEDRAVHRDATLGADDYALGKSVTQAAGGSA